MSTTIIGIPGPDHLRLLEPGPCNSRPPVMWRMVGHGADKSQWPWFCSGTPQGTRGIAMLYQDQPLHAGIWPVQAAILDAMAPDAKPGAPWIQWVRQLRNFYTLESVRDIANYAKNLGIFADVVELEAT